MCLLFASAMLCGVQVAREWPIADQAEARAAATHVAIVHIDSARQPRGVWGYCPANGRVIQAERGTLKFGDPVGVWIPCNVFPGSLRAIPMWAMHDDSYARIWLDARGEALDYEPLQFGPAKREAAN